MTPDGRSFHRALASGLIALAACGNTADWYYHWSCNSDAECLFTNPTGQASGDLDEGPDGVNCTQLLTFAAHFWGSAATNSCDQSPTPLTYTVTYDGNGSTGGSVPVDPTRYIDGQNVTVKGNTGNLARTGYLFANWNSKADGSGKAWSQGQIFRINGSNATLFAVWTPHP